MCVSFLVENDPSLLAAKLGLGAIHDVALTDAARVEPRGAATVLRLGAGGRIVGERMTFNPYVLRRAHLEGDLWAHALLGESHGLLILRAFSEWTSAEALVRNGIANVFEINCAYNRFASEASRFARDARDRLVLGNFKPSDAGVLLVPVLFDRSRRPDADIEREFAIITDDPHPGIARTGAAHVPVNLKNAAAWAWLHAVQHVPVDDGPGGEVDVDLDEVLEDQTSEGFQFSLFKSA